MPLVSRVLLSQLRSQPRSIACKIECRSGLWGGGLIVQGNWELAPISTLLCHISFRSSSGISVLRNQSALELGLMGECMSGAKSGRDCWPKELTPIVCCPLRLSLCQLADINRFSVGRMDCAWSHRKGIFTNGR